MFVRSTRLDSTPPIDHSTLPLQTDRVTTTDTKAIHYVLHHHMIYYKPSFVRNMLGSLLGEGMHPSSTFDFVPSLNTSLPQV